MKKLQNNFNKSVVSVAPMMKWTDRHCRFFHRQITKSAQLYTEMIPVNAVIYGKNKKFLDFSNEEQPVAIQLGGSNPKLLGCATKICSDLGFNEINLNVGCPSSKVRAGRFGACLMKEPQLVKKCLSAMKEASDKVISVKCRIGVDDMDDQIGLDYFIDECLKSDVKKFIIHARKALLQGLSPKQNREIPTLNYKRVKKLKERLGKKIVVIVNGGITDLHQSRSLLKWSDGIMVGRTAYKEPYSLASFEKHVLNKTINTRIKISEIMADYSKVMVSKFDCKLHSITRHMLGLYFGVPGAKIYRQFLTEKVIEYPRDTNLIINAAYAAEEMVINREILAA